MANQKDTYSVEVLGFTDNEQAVLASVFGLSSRRVPKFLRYDKADGPPDILLVDANDPAAIRDLSERNASKQIPTIVIGDSDCGTGWPVLPRPIRWMKLFQAFDVAIAAPSAQSLPVQSEAGRQAMPAPTPVRPTSTEAPVQPPTAVPAPTPARAPSAVSPTASARLPERTASATREIPVLNTLATPERQAKVSPADWVLVVDDNLTVREFMKNKLAAFNFNVDFAENGEQAIGFTGQKHYTCIFLDVIMPGIDGYQVCKLIKANRTAQKTAVVMLTSKDSPFDKIRGSMSGCDAYLTKPVDEEKLLETIVKFLPTRS